MESPGTLVIVKFRLNAAPTSTADAELSQLSDSRAGRYGPSSLGYSTRSSRKLVVWRVPKIVTERALSKLGFGGDVVHSNPAVTPPAKEPVSPIENLFSRPGGGTRHRPSP